MKKNDISNLDVFASLDNPGFQETASAFGATTYLSMTRYIEEMQRQATSPIYNDKTRYNK